MHRIAVFFYPCTRLLIRLLKCFDMKLCQKKPPFIKIDQLLVLLPQQITYTLNNPLKINKIYNGTFFAITNV